VADEVNLELIQIARRNIQRRKAPDKHSRWTVIDTTTGRHHGMSITLGATHATSEIVAIGNLYQACGEALQMVTVFWNGDPEADPTIVTPDDTCLHLLRAKAPECKIIIPKGKTGLRLATIQKLLSS